MANCGSPAHAGIDPFQNGWALSPSRLPRSRGDRPENVPLAAWAARAPPLTRGSTLFGPRAERAVYGSPAHAGIDPCFFHGVRDLAPAPPLTRGSTRLRFRHVRRRRGSPAHAGIDLLPSRSARRRKGLPAHAGIDPYTFGMRSIRMRLPRSRGDRPGLQRRTPVGCEAPPLTRGSTITWAVSLPPRYGSPAHAGIDPATAGHKAHVTGLPRSRGDRPSPDKLKRLEQSAPPLTRGSTRGRAARTALVPGSPAHAGIDPCSTARMARHRGLPRSRGDRPCIPAWDVAPCRAPPLTRGSTPAAER